MLRQGLRCTEAGPANIASRGCSIHGARVSCGIAQDGLTERSSPVKMAAEHPEKEIDVDGGTR